MKLQDIVNWHKWLGATATIFTIVLSITGVMLIHAVDFKLQEKFVDSGWLLNWYYISPKNPPRSYVIGGRIFTQIDGQLYLDDMILPGNGETLRGVILVNNVFVIAFDNSLFLLTAEGELIERLTSLQDLPNGLLSIGLDSENRIIIKSSQGLYAADLDILEWRAAEEDGITWSVSSELPATLQTELLRMYQGNGLSIERVVVDMHSGRILGKYGVWIMDLAVIVFLAMSISGWWAWFKRRALQREIDAEL